VPELPVGTVTFLFTDIEGSTQLWEREPERMRLALERHHAILRKAIEAHGGKFSKSSAMRFRPPLRFRLARLKRRLRRNVS